MYDWVLQRHADLNALRVPPYEPSGFHLVDFGKYCYPPLGDSQFSSAGGLQGGVSEDWVPATTDADLIGLTSVSLALRSAGR